MVGRRRQPAGLRGVNVKRWQDGQIVCRGVAAGMLNAAAELRRIEGHARRACTGDGAGPSRPGSDCPAERVGSASAVTELQIALGASSILAGGTGSGRRASWSGVTPTDRDLTRSREELHRDRQQDVVTWAVGAGDSRQRVRCHAAQDAKAFTGLP
jgi:hypothetical protein